MGGRGSSSGRANIGLFNQTKKNFEKYGKSTQNDKFFGDKYMISNKYFLFDHNPDENTSIAVFGREHFRDIKGNTVLIVGNDKAVYLKDWQIQPVDIERGMASGYAVKLNSNYYKPYTFKNSFNQVSMDKDLSFDDIRKIAKSQNNTKYGKPKHRMDSIFDLHDNRGL